LVSDGKNIFHGPDVCGDEPVMLAQILRVPCAVGADRVKSVQLLLQNAQYNDQALDVIILDDGYQNEHLEKDVQILLLDARHPFENGHCLPAGRLREDDCSRADIIVLTHADQITCMDLQYIKNELYHAHKKTSVVSGVHKPVGIFCDGVFIDAKELARERLFACAGIGSFSGFLQSLMQLEVNPAQVLEFSDHYSYRQCDLDVITELAMNAGCSGVITTEKDWCKLRLLLASSPEPKHLIWYVMRVEFEFLTELEYHTFMRVVSERLS
jgi:tetraacyldisaccharide 4'-kinase